jgi:hypothetical protein
MLFAVPKTEPTNHCWIFSTYLACIWVSRFGASSWWLHKPCTYQPSSLFWKLCNVTFFVSSLSSRAMRWVSMVDIVACVRDLCVISSFVSSMCVSPWTVFPTRGMALRMIPFLYLFGALKKDWIVLWWILRIQLLKLCIQVHILKQKKGG